MGHGDYERFTPGAIDQVWLRMRAGQSAKPTERELGLCTGTVSDRPDGGRCRGVGHPALGRAFHPEKSG